MPPTAPPIPAERFGRVIDLLCRVVAAHGGGGRIGWPLLGLLWSRLRRMAGRFDRLAARIRAGAPLTPRQRPALPRPGRSAPPRLPQGFAWLVRRVPQTSSAGSQLQHLLAEPEMTALIAAAPQMGRILRPLCRMLGIRPPLGLHKAPAARTPAAVSSPVAPVPTAPVPVPKTTRSAPRRKVPPRAPPAGFRVRFPPVPA